MKSQLRPALAVLLSLALAVVLGCQDSPPAKPAAPASRPPGPAAGHQPTPAEEADIKESLARLEPEDRKLAEAQKLCVVEENRLGSMGPPVKVVVDGQPVFICCKGCRKKALADPGKTLARAQELKGQSAAPKASEPRP